MSLTLLSMLAFSLTLRVGAHKMGWQLLIQINRNYLARIPGGQVRKSELYTVHHITIDTQSSSRNKEYELLTNLTYQLERDYRTVFVTRNWFDTIISGYLYHKKVGENVGYLLVGKVAVAGLSTSTGKSSLRRREEEQRNIGQTYQRPTCANILS